MDISLWIDRLYEDESLSDNLEQEEAQRLFSWAEKRLSECVSNEGAETIIGVVRRVGRLVEQGASFERLLAILEKNTVSNTPTSASTNRSKPSPRSSETNSAGGEDPASSKNL